MDLHKIETAGDGPGRFSPPCGFGQQIINEKLLAYAFILTHQGYPCVFWQDYFNWNLAQPDNQSGIDVFIRAH